MRGFASNIKSRTILMRIKTVKLLTSFPVKETFPRFMFDSKRFMVPYNNTM